MPGTRETLGTQMRAPYQEAIENISREITEFLDSPRVRSSEPDSGDKLASGFAELTRVSNGPVGEDLFAPLATLAPGYLGVTQIDDLRPGDVEITSTDMHVDCRVLALTNNQLRTLRSIGEQLPDHISCVLIPGSPENNVGDTFEVFRSQCQGRDTHVEYQQYDLSTNEGEEANLTGRLPVGEFFDRVAERKQSPELRRLQADRKNPINLLNLSADTLGSAFSEPEAIRTLRYRLLSLLPRPGTMAGLGKQTISSAQLVDLDASQKFLLYGERGSFSGYHMDLLNGTWVQCQTGLKLWLIYCGPWDDDVRKEYGENGEGWKPAPGTVKGILLAPGDTLIMRPGYPVIHAVLTIEDSFMIGGMIWPETGIAQVMTNMEFILKYHASTNEYAPRQLPQVLDALKALVEGDLAQTGSDATCTYTQSDMDSVDRLISFLKKEKLFHCECKGACSQPRLTSSDPSNRKRDAAPKCCPCFVSEAHAPGCTDWCHAAKRRTCVIPKSRS